MPLDFPLPPWLMALNSTPRCFTSDKAAMSHVIAATSQNIDDGGGPFGAMVTNQHGEMIALGVNRVRPEEQAILHGEVVALILAQKKLENHYLSELGDYTLYTTCAPCDMCCGAIRNSGIRRLVCGARTGDAEAVGFDEGIKPRDWVTKLVTRKISVTEDICRDACIKLLQDYIAAGGDIY